MKPGRPLMRTGFKNRGKPLRRYVGLPRSSKSNAGSGTTGEGGSVVSSAGRLRGTRSRFLADPAAVIRERSGGVCEIQLDGCKGRASQKSHRITQKSGGRHGAAKERSDRPSNALDSCWWCHLVITERPWLVDAKGNGWVLEEWQEPTREPVNRRGEWGYLTDDGRFVPYEEACA